MRKWNMVLALSLGAFLSAGGHLAGQTANTEQTAATGQTAAIIPNQPMTMDVPGALPSGFRGGNTDDGPVNVLEDGNYKIQEHSVLYNDTTSGVGQSAQGTRFTTPPTINWTTEKEEADGSIQSIGNVNNNRASMNVNFF